MVLTERPSVFKETYKCNECGNKKWIFTIKNQKDARKYRFFWVVDRMILVASLILVSYFVSVHMDNRFLAYLVSVAIILPVWVFVYFPIRRIFIFLLLYPKLSDEDT